MKPVDPHPHEFEPASAEQLACEALDNSLDQIPDDISARLRQQRLQLQGLDTRPHHKPAAWWIPAGLVASVVMAAAIWLQPTADTTPAAVAVTQPSTSNRLMTGDYDLESSEWLELTQLSDQEWDMLQDLDFVLWLSELPDESLSPAPVADQAG
ncbi:hypothetical protein [Parathalassolituus penaei]|uniref:Uncharacterized protein n=1 Tax=Parathalassolituus penaei TaxID=2997323 RepID=A0A9X3IUF3_9GAMM|nr:hypothetical protein [Parathalassolituus penaei]MCY0966909.1 hypothetical protein [Parathalassolituus penaei]